MALILTRRESESICIGHLNDDIPNIDITVIQLKGNQVRFGVTVDRRVSIHRKEVQDRITLEEFKSEEKNNDETRI